MEKILGAAELRERLGAGRGERAFSVWLWREEKAGRFPARVRLSERVVGWRATDIEAWLAARPRGTSAKAA